MVLAMDCEMGYTLAGMELLRVSIVSFDGEKVLDEIIKPSSPIICLNTRFSGVKEINTTKTLLEILDQIGQIATRKTIFIGHALDNDLRTLRLHHDRVIDTIQLYPHPRGLPFKKSLKHVVKSELGRFIQDGEHCSIEDSQACIDLVRKYLSHYLFELPK